MSDENNMYENKTDESNVEPQQLNQQYADQPMNRQPVYEQNADHQPMNRQPVYEQNADHQPVNQQYISHQPMGQQPVDQQYANRTPVNNTVYNPYNGPSYNSKKPEKGQATGLGIASMVCGIVSIPAICITDLGIVFSFILGVVAVVLGIVQLVKNQKKGMAIAGIVCGAIGILLCAVIMVIALFLISSEFYSDFTREFNYKYY